VLGKKALGKKTLGKNCQGMTKRLVASMLTVFLLAGLVSCSQPTPQKTVRRPGSSSGRISEVAPPIAIQELRRSLEAYQPQVKILSPRADEVLQDTQVSVKLQIQDLPLFQDEDLNLGPHLHLLLDNQPYGSIYDPKQPIVFDDLEPGTHTLRAFAATPWDESFKNEGAYAQTTFHIFAKTPENKPDLSKPLLTFSRPQATYGAEPILLDFYISNVPLHLAAQEDATDDIPDWQIRCTVNGESFTFDRWEPIYLKGLKPGKNWIQMELLDDQGKPFPNAFNNTLRLIEYQPGGQDTLAQLTRGEIAGTIAPRIVDPNYEPPAPEPEPAAVEEEIEEPAPMLEPIPAIKPAEPQPVQKQEEKKPEPKEAAIEEPPVEKIRPVPIQVTPIQPVPEKPVEKSVEKPAEKPAAIEPPAINPPAINPPAINPPVIKQPVIEQPVIKPPVIKPPIEDPVIKSPVIAPPVIESPTIAPPVIEAPVIERPVIKSPVIEQPTINQPIIRQPVIEQPIIKPPIRSAAPKPADPVLPRSPIKDPPSPTPARSSEEVRQRAKEKMGDATEKLEDTFDALRERSGKVSQDTQKFFQRFRKTPADTEQQRAKGLLNRFQQPVGKMNDDLPIVDLENDPDFLAPTLEPIESP
jgi:hypothetical protein